MTIALPKCLKQTGAALALALQFALPAAAPATAQPPGCDADCLNAVAQNYLEALLAQDWSGLPWTDSVRFSENDVGLMIGDGLWGTATALEEGFTLADPQTGNVLWLGVVEEHGQPAYLAQRLKVEDGRISEVESLVGREGTPGPFANTEGYRVPPAFAEALPEDQRLPRARMISLVDGYFHTRQLNDGVLHTVFAEDCERRVNGLSTTHGEEHWAARAISGCQAQLEQGLFKPVDLIRERRFPLVDEARGVVVALSLQDHALRYTEYETLDGETRRVPVEYPNTHALLELFKIRDGAIERIEGVSVFQPYLMPTPWRAGH